MTMALPRPSTCGTRPAYLDNLFRDSPPSLASPSLHSANSSISYSSTFSEHRLAQTMTRPLSPAFEEDSADDRGSVRSLRLNLSPRFRHFFGKRRTYPEVRETVKSSSGPTTPSLSQPGSRRPSLPKLNTSLSPPPRSRSVPLKEKPLPAAPPESSQELKCHRCYYFAARNCNGWVMGGSHGDACEQCLQAGFFGAP